MINVEGYDQFGGHHWETSALRNVLAFHGLRAPHTGQPFSEAMLFGLTGGVGIVYFVFEYEGFPPHVALGTRYPFDPVDKAVKRLRLPASFKHTKSQKKSVDSLLSSLVVGEPALVWADMFTLSYNALPPSPFPGMMPVVVYLYDIDTETVRIADRAEVPLTTTTGELAAARARQPSLRNRMLSFEFDDAAGFDVKKLPAAVEQAIQDTVRLYLEAPPKGPANNFGLAALRKWSDLVADAKAKRGWSQVFAEPAHLFEALKETYTAIEHRGSGGAAARTLYADFLDEAAALLDRPALSEAGGLFREAGRRWTDLALSALPDSVDAFKETRELINRSQQVFKESGNQAWREMRDIAERLATLTAEVGRSFPLDGAGRTALLASLGACIEALCAAEQAAAEALQAAAA